MSLKQGKGIIELEGENLSSFEIKMSSINNKRVRIRKPARPCPRNQTQRGGQYVQSSHSQAHKGGGGRGRTPADLDRVESPLRPAASPWRRLRRGGWPVHLLLSLAARSHLPPPAPLSRSLSPSFSLAWLQQRGEGRREGPAAAPGGFYSRRGGSSAPGWPWGKNALPAKGPPPAPAAALLPRRRRWSPAGRSADGSPLPP